MARRAKRCQGHRRNEASGTFALRLFGSSKRALGRRPKIFQGTAIAPDSTIEGSPVGQGPALAVRWEGVHEGSSRAGPTVWLPITKTYHASRNPSAGIIR